MKLFLSYTHLLLILSLTATTPAIAKYAKSGCKDKCGNVTIPYPFGIGAGCSINKWYIVDCSSSKPYLPALNHLEVLSVDLQNQTVTVSTPKITNCQNPAQDSSEIMGVNLGESPFVFSKSHNILFFEGCGNVAMMDDGNMLTGCSTSCRNVSFTRSDRNNCYGIRCCQSAVPYYLKSYNINITSLGEEDGGCGSAFLIDKTSYEEERFSVTNIFSIPVSLLWTLTNSDQITCCDDQTPIIHGLDVFNGNPMDTWKCYYYYAQSFEQNPYLKDGCTGSSIGTPKYAKTGCLDKCGNVTIPYPFGIGANCSVNKWYIVDCIFSIPILRALDHLQLLGVDLENNTVTVNTPRTTACHTSVWNSSEIMDVDLGRSPFLFLGSQNKFVFEGCGTAAIIYNGSVLAGCSAVCSSLTRSDGNNCLGISCCQTAINPYYFKSYNINLTGLEDEGACGYATLVDERRFSNPISVKNTSFIPISLLWTLADSDQVTCCYDRPRIREKVDILDGSTMDTWICYLLNYDQGNPYLRDGCNYIYGDADPTEDCRSCHDSGGSYSRKKIYDIDGNLFSDTFSCDRNKEKTSLGVILGDVGNSLKR